MISDSVLDLDASATLAAAEAGVDAQRREEVADLVRVLHWADLHADDPQAGPGAVPVSRGGDKLVQLGGEGTPMASELCWAELAIARGTGVVSTENFAADALDLRHRLPLLYEAVLDGVLPVWVARKVAAMSRKLTKGQAGLVDAAVAAAVEQSPGRILSIAEAKVIEADLEGHRARVAEDAAKVGVRLSQPRPGNQVDEIEGEPGTRRVTLKLPAGAALDFDATVDEIADALIDQITAETGDCQLTRGQAEAKAVELLSNPHAAAAFLDQVNEPPPVSPEGEDAPPPLPAPKKKRPATIYLHLTDAVLAGLVPGAVRVEGMGPMLLEQLHELLGNRDITLQPVIDLNQAHSVNGYEHPTLVKERTLLRMLGDAFPHSTNTGYRRLDHDHATAYDPNGPPGQTGDHNDAPLTRKHHRAKTHADYQLHQLGLGTYRWVTPHGLGRLVTTTGTRTFQPIQGPAGSVGEIYYTDRFAELP
ncbi:DUF222 domain-containing protein [Nocardioides panacisoli]|uniref:DUF222 domain-containing protein n=1 Tax=Nocardioides panacisoli TaxID=627624 RepID=A0ABP7J1Z7_9ACTN